MMDIIDFVMENHDKIVDYEVEYFSNGFDDKDGTVTFTMKNGDQETFQIC